MTASVTINPKPDWDEIDLVREQAESFLVAQGIDTDSQHAVTMIACELAENAVKYGHFTSDDARIDVTLSCDDQEITVEVRSPLKQGDEDHLDRLDEMIQWIRGYQDPFQAYLERLKEVSGQDLDHEESGLGLVRIAYEGQSTLDFYINDDMVVAVSAVRARGQS